jgi:hypothetical protein
MEQGDQHREDRRLMAAVDRRRARENAGRLVLELAARPDLDHAVEKPLHRRGHGAVPGGRPPRDAVGPAEIVERCLIDGALQRLGVGEVGHAPEAHGGVADGLRAGADGAR